MNEDETIENHYAIAAYLESGITPRDQWRIGTEHEKFLFDKKTLAPVPYEGTRGVQSFLQQFIPNGWQGVYENDALIALHKDNASITLEPGGQIELSGEAVENIHQTCEEVARHLRECREIAEPLQLGLFGMGFAPFWHRNEIHWMPKARYDIMRRYMPQKGDLGLDMMLRTCSIQVNVDFDSEALMVRQFRIALALQSVVQFLFASSPLKEGERTDWLSYRSHVWRDTDDDRCGDLPFVFEDGFGFERYASYLLDVPMYFYRRDGAYHDVAGHSFRDFMAGTLPEARGARATFADMRDHMSTVFTDVRLKHYLEVRGADGGHHQAICALAAFWTGLLYDSSIIVDVWHRIKGWASSQEHREALRQAIMKDGFASKINTNSAETVQNLVLDLLEMAQEALIRRHIVDSEGRDESLYLAPLWQQARAQETFAHQLLQRWNGEKEALYDLVSY